MGLQIHDSDRLDIIEGVIRGQPDKVSDVIELLNVNAAITIIGIDMLDIKSLSECGNLFQFIQVSATGKSDLSVSL